ncbi:MAG: GH25 family lysozyme [Clostridia bacterium]
MFKKRKIKFCFICFSLAFCLSVCSSFTCLASEDTILGIDVSVYQGEIDFEKLSDNSIEAVYIRAGEGDSIIDARFKENYEGAIEYGLDFGFYFYVTATTQSEAVTQAKRFARLIDGIDYTLRPAMDFESFDDLSSDEINQIALSFLVQLEKSTGIEPVVYSDAYNAAHTFSSELSSYPLWVADYDVSDIYSYTLSDDSSWSSWSGFQFSDSLKITAIDSNVDGDLFTQAVFVDESEKSTAETDSSSQTSSSTTTTTQIINAKFEYKVQEGDTLSAIATKYDLTVNEIASYNDIDDIDLIYVGEILYLPTVTDDVNSSIDEKIVRYTVSSGDTLSEIASEFNTSVSEIASYNNIANQNLIYIGEVLLIK